MAILRLGMSSLRRLTGYLVPVLSLAVIAGCAPPDGRRTASAAAVFGSETNQRDCFKFGVSYENSGRRVDTNPQPDLYESGVRLSTVLGLGRLADNDTRPGDEIRFVADKNGEASIELRRDARTLASLTVKIPHADRACPRAIAVSDRYEWMGDFFVTKFLQDQILLEQSENGALIVSVLAEAGDVFMKTSRRYTYMFRRKTE